MGLNTLGEQCDGTPHVTSGSWLKIVILNEMVKPDYPW